MKIAIVHDELLRKGGAERVVISMHKLFPEADIFTSAYNPESTFEYFKECNIKISFLNAFVKSEKALMAFFFPLGVLAFRLFNLREYDLIIISSAHGAQYVRKPKNVYCINYVHYPFRLIWVPESYSFYHKRVVRLVMNPILGLLRKIDKHLTVKADYTFFNSLRTKEAYLKVFDDRTAFSVLNPPIPLEDFYISDEEKKYFLVVSRFEAYKKVDLVIDAFNRLKHEKLIIVGSGTMERQLREQAKSENIVFEKGVSSQRLKELYANCKALIFPQIEDFGITPIECNASGRPIIAFEQGGVLETMISAKTSESGTAIFFNEQSSASILKAVSRFNATSFEPEMIRKNALRFSEEKFHKILLDQVKSKSG